MIVVKKDDDTKVITNREEHITDSSSLNRVVFLIIVRLVELYAKVYGYKTIAYYEPSLYKIKILRKRGYHQFGDPRDAVWTMIKKEQV
ncbi:hypothetical protein [Butyrivibrio sp. NC2007]|uniref:hypothetical protein n=1 Tax=Butyrivibrio sp. NC2007 TaxID=1280683 RepID=UPI0003B564D6|nr:hypothetical protein [Butyrivibrio sp. NC2007]